MLDRQCQTEQINYRNKRVQRFGEKLRTLRKQRGMTIKELAPLTGYSTHSHISEIENGKKKPPLESIACV